MSAPFGDTILFVAAQRTKRERIREVHPTILQFVVQTFT